MIWPVLIMDLDLDERPRREQGIGARLRARIDTLRGSRKRGDVETVDDDEARALVERARDGDGEAFALLFRGYRLDVLRVCRRMLGDPQSAEDAVSEVFLRARSALEGFDSDRPFRPWLVSVAGHYCIDQLRRRSSEARVFSDAEPRESDLQSPGPTPLSRLVAAERREAVGRAIESLPIRYRLPLILRYFDDMDYDSIAKTIGVTRNQVGSLLFRAKRLLREEVDALGEAGATRGPNGAGRAGGEKRDREIGRPSRRRRR